MLDDLVLLRVDDPVLGIDADDLVAVDRDHLVLRLCFALPDVTLMPKVSPSMVMVSKDRGTAPATSHHDHDMTSAKRRLMNRAVSKTAAGANLIVIAGSPSSSPAGACACEAVSWQEPPWQPGRGTPPSRLQLQAAWADRK